MIYFYPRNPYRYATAGHHTKKATYRMTRGERWMCGLVWMAAMMIIAITQVMAWTR